MTSQFLWLSFLPVITVFNNSTHITFHNELFLNFHAYCCILWHPVYCSITFRGFCITSEHAYVVPYGHVLFIWSLLLQCTENISFWTSFYILINSTNRIIRTEIRKYHTISVWLIPAAVFLLYKKATLASIRRNERCYGSNFSLFQFSFSEFYQNYCHQIYHQIFSFHLQQEFLQIFPFLSHTIYGSLNMYEQSNLT